MSLVAALVFPGFAERDLTLLQKPSRHRGMQGNKGRIAHDLGENEMKLDVGTNEFAYVANRLAIGLQRTLQLQELLR